MNGPMIKSSCLFPAAMCSKKTGGWELIINCTNVTSAIYVCTIRVIFGICFVVL